MSLNFYIITIIANATTRRSIMFLFNVLKKTNKRVIVEFLNTWETKIFDSLLDTSRFFGKSNSWTQSYIWWHNKKYNVNINYLLENNLLTTTTNEA